MTDDDVKMCTCGLPDYLVKALRLWYDAAIQYDPEQPDKEVSARAIAAWNDASAACVKWTKAGAAQRPKVSRLRQKPADSFPKCPECGLPDTLVKALFDWCAVVAREVDMWKRDVEGACLQWERAGRGQRKAGT